MDNLDEAFENQEIKRLQLFLYLVPIFGFLPAIWTLYQRKSDRQHRDISRLVVTLTLTWVLGYALLNTGANTVSESNQQGWGTSLLFVNSLLTSSYFLVNIWLMVRLWQRQSLKLPGISQIAKHLP
jgi:hypothetical protein